MSFIATMTLRKAGRLNEALQQANADWQHEKSPHACMAMFWVQKDICDWLIKEQRLDEANQRIALLEQLLPLMNDTEGIASKAIERLKEHALPFYPQIRHIEQMSKDGCERVAYEALLPFLGEDLPTALHERVGWVVYRYLKRMPPECQSATARRALLHYITLKNKRPSLLHSQMLLMAIAIKERFADFKLLNFIAAWDVNTFAEADFQPSQHEEQMFRPLAERVVEHCFDLGYGLQEVLNTFLPNMRFTDEKVKELYARSRYFAIFNQQKQDETAAIALAEHYAQTINGTPMRNEYHSAILHFYLRHLPKAHQRQALRFVKGWGMGNFRDEDWLRANKDDRRHPALVEKTLVALLSACEKHELRRLNERPPAILQKALDAYADNESLMRLWVKAKLAACKDHEALETLRCLIRKQQRFYLWKELADITPDEQLKLSALCKAILLQPKDEFLGKVHFMLALLLKEQGLLSEAQAQINAYVETYRRNGWTPTPEMQALANAMPPGIAPCADVSAFYNAHLDAAHDFLFPDLHWNLLVVMNFFTQINPKTGRKTDKVALADTNGNTLSVNRKQWPSGHSLAKFACVEAKIAVEGKRKNIVAMRPSAANGQDIWHLETVQIVRADEQRQRYVAKNEAGLTFVVPYYIIRSRVDCGIKARLWWVDAATKEGKGMRRTIAVEFVDAENKPKPRPEKNA